MTNGSWDWQVAQAAAPEYARRVTGTMGGGAAATSGFALLTLCAALLLLSSRVRAVIVFCWSCFLRPLGKTSSQAERLDRFYATQATVYDVTRQRLLRGRKAMLQLAAQHAKDRHQQQNNPPLIWIDLGGGTGWNIEQMALYIDLNIFQAIYLIDLCEPLLEVARARFRARGWTHVHVLCQDASSFTIPGLAMGDQSGRKADLVTMSYSLSMIPPFYATLDRIDSILAPDTGILGVCDFYAAPPSTLDKGRGCHPLVRWFWTWWFSWDHVDLHPARRNYLEHRFGTVKCFNGRNHFIVPWLIQIPYYIWIGCSRQRDTTQAVQAFEIECGNRTVVPPSFPELTWDGLHAEKEVSVAMSRSSSRGKAAGTPFPASSFHFQKHVWRVPFIDTAFTDLFRTWVYGFVWEDPWVDMRLCDIGSDDTVLCITSAGDNALHYAIEGNPQRIHAVDMNACQGHILELKLAMAAARVPHKQVWALFGQGRAPARSGPGSFRHLLDTQLAIHLSSHAYQFWRNQTTVFDRNFHFRGYSGHALRLAKAAFTLIGVGSDVNKMVNTRSIPDQATIWKKRVRWALLNPILTRLALANPAFLWNALGVPRNQLACLTADGTTVSQFASDTLDPVAEQTSLATDNYHYHLCLAGRYSPQAAPLYLRPKGWEALCQPGALDAFRLHTDAMVNVLRGFPDGHLTRAILMDHLDWFAPIPADRPAPTLAQARDESDRSVSDADREVVELFRAVAPGGTVFWRSAGKYPWYSQRFVQAGFVDVKPLQIRESGTVIDNVNMYASFWRATKPTH